MKFTNIFCVFLISLLYEASSHELKASLAFIVDDTASMGTYIEQLRDTTGKLFDAVLTSNSSQIDEFVLVTFNDPDAQFRIVTNDSHKFNTALANIDVHGGGDCPEMAMRGIALAIEKSKPNSKFYVITNAAAKDHDQFETIKELCQHKSIQISFILTGTCGSITDRGNTVYHRLAEATSGQVFHCGRNSIYKMILYIIESVRSKKTLLDHITFQKGYGNHLHFTVDSKIKDVIISVSGIKANLSVVGPQGMKESTELLVNNIGCHIIKIKPSPGVYTITAGSVTETSIHITGSTYVDFEYGFSSHKPNSTLDTSTMLLLGVDSYLSIVLTNDDRDIKLETVEMRYMNSNIIMTKPLILLDENQQLYVTEKFSPPSVMFKIAVNGYINNKERITRVGSTTVKGFYLRQL